MHTLYVIASPDIGSVSVVAQQRGASASDVTLVDFRGAAVALAATTLLKRRLAAATTDAARERIRQQPNQLRARYARLI